MPTLKQDETWCADPGDSWGGPSRYAEAKVADAFREEDALRSLYLAEKLNGYRCRICRGRVSEFAYARHPGVCGDRQCRRQAFGNKPPPRPPVVGPKFDKATHCNSGHLLSDDNVIIFKRLDGGLRRFCRECKRVGRVSRISSRNANVR